MLKSSQTLRLRLRLQATPGLLSIFISLLLFCLLLSPAGRSAGAEAAQMRTVVANTATLNRGETGTMTIDLVALGGENAVGFSVNFDPAELSFVSVVAGSGASGTSLIINTSQTASGRVGISIAKSPGTSFAAGTHQIAVVTFAALVSGTQSSTAISFGDMPVPREFVDVNAMIVTGGFQGTNLTINGGCVFSISPPARNFSAAGGTGTVDIVTGSMCGWSTTNNTPWVLVSGGFSGTGNGTMTFQVEANTGASRTGTITVAGQTFTIRQGANFADVPLGNPFYEVIGKFSATGITSGCGFTPQGQPLYCPSASVTREQMAVFIIRAAGQFNPPPPAMQRFTDVPPANIFYAFIEEMAVRGITSGCGAGVYCPGVPVAREQMAVFVIRGLGQFNPPPPAMQRFTDVPPSNIFYAFIEEMAVRGITLGCGGGNYCPSASVNREQMAAFLVRAFGL